MKSIIRILMFLFIGSYSFVACNNKKEEDGHNHEEVTDEHHEHGEGHEDKVHFTEQQFTSLNMKIDTILMRNLSTYVETNGQLEVPPQNEATVSTVIGANITDIKVIEGDQVSKGQVLAYVSHPDLIELQTEYIDAWNQLEFKEQDYNRQKKLYEEKVGSGKEFQRVKATYQSLKGKVLGLEAQLRLLHLSPTSILEGNIYDKIAVKSPIDGFVRLVEVKLGQYVAPQKELFEIVNIDHVHADFMIYEKDISLVKKGQTIAFNVESNKENTVYAEIYSVGKNFEQDPKAVHIHAEIENKDGMLLPGMYIRGRIIVDDQKSLSLPQAAIVREGNKYFIFSAQKEKDGDTIEWEFTPIEVNIGVTDEDWVEVKLLKSIAPNTQFAYNNAYYLMAEMKKGEAEHSH
jgi:cobalt-zinc-cadmium efflux system membrane fusion protein